ncbi:phosphoglycolate phosphatase [Chitinivorax tropicus]|uniref:Phosphoglycolate phosphatase n=1 Tax=Chitinivorax tropicus TaxID=714531 RepID=A0A840MSI6_9PROT|nr:phosphoglycolate phosphatase [Chitinivorax tropicus]MBB5019722.1 phosphoglycolate phosphatase [Chitinivorax tropicus]
MTLPRIQVVALDLDGTLLDTLTDLAGAANAMRQQLGLPPLPLERVKTYVGDGMASLVKRTLTDQRDGEPTPGLFEQGLEGFKRCYDQLLHDATRAYPDVEAGLQQMQAAGLRLACITNKPKRFTEPLLASTGLAPFFELILSGDSLAEKKPHPMPLLHACEFFKVQPAHMAMIGDSINDILAAKQAGCLSIAVPYGYRHAGPVEALGADHVVAGLVEAADLLLNMGSH